MAGAVHGAYLGGQGLEQEVPPDLVQALQPQAEELELPVREHKPKRACAVVVHSGALTNGIAEGKRLGQNSQQLREFPAEAGPK